MKACRNPLCTYHVEVVIVEQLNRFNAPVKIAVCKDGFQMPLKFLPTEENWCPTCQKVADMLRADAEIYRAAQEI